MPSRVTAPSPPPPSAGITIQNGDGAVVKTVTLNVEAIQQVAKAQAAKDVEGFTRAVRHLCGDAMPDQGIRNARLSLMSSREYHTLQDIPVESKEMVRRCPHIQPMLGMRAPALFATLLARHRTLTPVVPSQAHIVRVLHRWCDNIGDADLRASVTGEKLHEAARATSTAAE